MTELHIGLIGLGATAVIGVVAYNTWQEYRYRKLAEQVLNVQHTDVLLEEPSVAEADRTDIGTEPEDGSGSNGNVTSIDVLPPVGTECRTMPVFSNERIEPVLRLDPEPCELTTAYQESDAKRDVSAETLDVPENASLPEPTSASVSARIPDEDKLPKTISEPIRFLSPLIDYVASFEAVEPAPAYQILGSQRDVLAGISKPVHWIGYNESTSEWENIVDDDQNQYRRIRVGVQLVDRHGPLGDRHLSAFYTAMQDLADELMAVADLPPCQPALASAVKLDEFCASVDIQIGINVISQGVVFPGTKLRALAEAAGMVIDADGRFVRCDDEGNVLYVVHNQEAAGFSVDAMKTMSTHGVTFLLDVPCVSHGERVFNQMVDLAKRFADVLRGTLVDDNRQPLSDSALEPIRRQIGQYQLMMAARNLPAGGSLARRLFS